MILNDELIMNENDVIELAGLQLQVSFGDHDPEKHKLSFIGYFLSYH